MTARTSPLAHAAAALAAASNDAVQLAEIPFLPQLNIRLDAKNATGRLPLEPNTCTRSGETTILWLGPDEWLAIGPSGPLRDLPATFVDVSAQRTTLLVTGRSARDLLAHGCSLDLDPRAFGPGHCAQTLLARAQVILVPQDDPHAVWILVRSSFAGYLADWLIDAASDYLR